MAQEEAKSENTPNVEAALSTVPKWLHITPTSHHHNGHPCVIVGGGDQNTTALVCSDGYVEIS